jgi:pimeloyl-ACP methyl ester carboxylesterase
MLPFDDRGDGPPLLFIHGFLNDATVWGGVIDELVQDFRCVAIDLPGHGRSPGNGAGTYGRSAVLDDIRRVLDHLEIAQTTVVGHSLGGYLALALAIENPERVTGLGLVGAGPGFRKPESREKWNESVEAIAADRDIPEGMEVISMHADSMVMDNLGAIEVPTAVVVGERDKGFLASAAVFAKHLNVVENAVVEGAGHMVHAKAAPEVAAVIRSTFTDG